jgi:aspartokinase/homoserine dehydrogenase 1
MSALRWRVLKFGGTSVAGGDRLTAAVAATLEAARESRVLVVVSALAGVTDQLVGLVEAAVAGDPVFRDGLRRLRDRHRTRLREVASGRPALAAADALDRVLPALETRLEGVFRLGEAPPGTRAEILAAGERLSLPLFAAALAGTGRAVESIDATELVAVEGERERGQPDLAVTRAWVASRLSGRGTDLAVVPGFFGAGRDGRLRLLGRGGSDTSATLLGAALDADRVEIWTDVDGVHTADPRVDPRAAPLPRLDYDAADALVRAGARVLHEGALAPARAAGVPVWVRDTFGPRGAGTWIEAPAAATAGDRR